MASGARAAASGHAHADSVSIRNPTGRSAVVLVCEHASNFIPPEFEGLGLSPAARTSHVAWDPGALGVARGLSEMLDAPLVVQNVSRLVYDCNRPPEAPSAMPERSERFAIPGNRSLSPDQKRARVDRFYQPFCARLGGLLDDRLATGPVLATVHSFTPVFHGERRDVELGILHDDDARLADAMLAACTAGARYDVRRNEPYGPADGVTHTLAEHALPRGLLNVMIEIRSDLIADAPAEREMADWLGDKLLRAIDGISPRDNRPIGRELPAHG